MAPEARVYRTDDDDRNTLIQALMEVRTFDKSIERPSWTMYVNYLLDKEAAEVFSRYQNRINGK
jgi:L-fucose mutarotase/ribose pyranase (RbsD/FucU family)